MTEPKRPDDDGPPADAREPVMAKFDWSEATPSTAVVEAVAIAADREPTELEPLDEIIDTDAFDTLLRSMGTKSTAGDASVTFAFDGQEVTVHRDGTVAVRPDSAREESESRD